MVVDLHMHSTASDGNLAPAEVVRLAAAAGLKIIALADHESTAGFAPALAAGMQLNVTVIPAVELLTLYKGKEVHLLGYFHNPHQKHLQEKLAELRGWRTEGAQKAVEVLNKYGYGVNWEDIESIAGTDTAISKGHILRVLRKNGSVKDFSDAAGILTRFLNEGGLAHYPHDFSFAEGIELIRQADGIPVVAHPGLIGDDTIVEELCSGGIDGLEVYYHYFGVHREEWVQRYLALADQKNLLKTGGSDYHGTVTAITLGETEIPLAGVRKFLELMGISENFFGGA